MLDDHRRTNLANWNDRVAGHLGEGGYSVDRLVDDPDWVTKVVEHDAAILGDVSGLSILHSQCHIGTDTLSWAKLGATVTGLDFSSEAIAAATDIASRLGVDATFVETELYDARAHIDDTFDLVYTSVGAICWLPDIVRWGEIMAGFVRSGGRFWIRDGHPMLFALDDERTDDELVVSHPYFHHPEPMLFSATQSSWARRRSSTPTRTSGRTRCPR